MWCVPQLDQDYLQRMEEVLDVLSQPPDERAPVVALDERPVQLLDSVRPATSMAPGRPARHDYEYARCGTANVFCIVEPKAGRHQTHATPNRTAPQFAGALKRIATTYPAAATIHLVMDNLNTHCEKSLTTSFGAEEGHRLWSRFTVHYTPKHGSWLNPAELEASLWSRQCLGRQRVATLAELRQRTAAWNNWANRTRIKIDWRFSTADARRVFHYKGILMHGSKH
jgi:transposase